MKAATDTIVTAIAERARPGQRFLVAIAGAPGAGKSTLADALCETLNLTNPARAAVLPMDGFHLDNAVLKARGMLAKKGALQTFDADGFASIIGRIRRGDRDVIVPVFERETDTARAGARLIAATTEIIIVEGNYLLLDVPEWAQSARHYDLTVFLDVPRALLKERLIQRWIDYGLNPKAANARACGNDLSNADIVINAAPNPDIQLTFPDHHAQKQSQH